MRISKDSKEFFHPHVRQFKEMCGTFIGQTHATDRLPADLWCKTNHPEKTRRANQAHAAIDLQPATLVSDKVLCSEINHNQCTEVDI